MTHTLQKTALSLSCMLDAQRKTLELLLSLITQLMRTNSIITQMFTLDNSNGFQLAIKNKSLGKMALNPYLTIY